MPRFLTSLIFAGALAAPLIVSAQPPHKYYDKTHKDYHEWNSNEDNMYHQFLTERHVKVHEFEKAKPSEQQAYWKWRHEHGDH